MAIDPPGTCHRVGCPSKGKHSPHHDLPTLKPPGDSAATFTARVKQMVDDITPPKIGAPDDFTSYEQPSCPGFPEIGVDINDLDASCSITGVRTWWVHPERPVTPAVMAQLVDQHKRECTNRKAAP